MGIDVYSFGRCVWGTYLCAKHWQKQKDEEGTASFFKVILFVGICLPSNFSVIWYPERLQDHRVLVIACCTGVFLIEQSGE